MNKNFNELGISAPILKAIEEMGFQTPTEVQSKVIPHILNQEDLIVMSKTGSGKTAVFGIPLLQLTNPDSLEPQALILTPTRELAVQIESDLKQMSAYLPHKTTAVYGQHSMNLEIQTLKKGPSIVIGTPGRAFDHIRHGNLKVKNIRFLVLDEADRMLDMGFIDQVFKIIKTLPRNRITLLFSATIPPEIQSICRGYMKDPVTIEIESKTKTVDTIDQAYYRVNRNEKRMQLHRILTVERPESCLIFCNTRYAVDQVQKFLSTKGYASQAIHGDIPQGKRLSIMQQFKQGKIHMLVATDVAARGIHIDDLSLVINYDVPLEKDNYVHRIGRTGRAGKGGRAITFVTGDDIMSLYEIEEHIGAPIEEADLPTDSIVHASKAGAEKWIHDKFQESALAPAFHSAPKEPQKNEMHADASSPNKKRRRRRPKGPGNPAGDAPDRRTVEPPSEHARSAHADVPVLTKPAERMPDKQLVQQNAAPTDPFFQRILKKITKK
jgi:ATP-dependent RNA helicase DeaD